MFLGRLVTGLPGEWIHEVRKSLAVGFLGKLLTPGSSCRRLGGSAGGMGRGAERRAHP